MARRSSPFIRHPARTVVVSVGFAAFFGAIAGGRALLLPAAPMTWIVDDGGGAGVHFTDIQPALDAAVDGDLVLVHPGNYSGFTLTESLSILGLPGGPGVKVPIGNAVGIAGEAAVANLTFKDFNATGCTGTLVLDSLLFAPTPSAYPKSVITIRDCADVRVLGADSAGRHPGVIVDNSKVELVSCLLAGGDGHNNLGFSAYAGDGESAVTILGGGRVYAALSQATGGEGGDFTTFGSSGYAGAGGDGIEVADGDLLLLGRGQELVQGGKGGASHSIYGYGGDGGNGLSVKAGCSARHSGVKLHGGKGGNAIGYIGYSGGKGKPVAVFSGGSAAQATPPDPALERTAVPQAGGIGQIKLRTKPGVFSRLFVGNVPIIQPSANVFVDNLVIKEASYALGFAPANGVVNASFPLDPSWTPGTVVYAQAMSIFPGGEIRRTNSVPLVVH
jgi:hypothetical protein